MYQPINYWEDRAVLSAFTWSDYETMVEWLAEENIKIIGGLFT